MIPNYTTRELIVMLARDLLVSLGSVLVAIGRSMGAT